MANFLQIFVLVSSYACQRCWNTDDDDDNDDDDDELDVLAIGDAVGWRNDDGDDLAIHGRRKSVRYEGSSGHWKDGRRIRR